MKNNWKCYKCGTTNNYHGAGLCLTCYGRYRNSLKKEKIEQLKKMSPDDLLKLVQGNNGEVLDEFL